MTGRWTREAPRLGGAEGERARAERPPRSSCRRVHVVLRRFTARAEERGYPARAGVEEAGARARGRGGRQVALRLRGGVRSGRVLRRRRSGGRQGAGRGRGGHGCVGRRGGGAQPGQLVFVVGPAVDGGGGLLVQQPDLRLQLGNLFLSGEQGGSWIGSRVGEQLGRVQRGATIRAAGCRCHRRCLCFWRLAHGHSVDGKADCHLAG